MKWWIFVKSARPGAALLISYRVQCMYLYSNVPHFHTHLAIGSDASQMALSFAMLLLGLLFFSSVSANTPGQKFENQLNSPDLSLGLSNRTASPQLTTEGTVVSQQRDDFPPHQCADSNTTTICVVPEAPAPWLALDLGRGAHVERVEISSREDCCGERLSNFQVRVTETLPPSGISLVFS